MIHLNTINIPSTAEELVKHRETQLANLFDSIQETIEGELNRRLINEGLTAAHASEVERRVFPGAKDKDEVFYLGDKEIMRVKWVPGGVKIV